jgi:hypothetical protein
VRRPAEFEYRQRAAACLLQNFEPGPAGRCCGQAVEAPVGRGVGQRAQCQHRHGGVHPRWPDWARRPGMLSGRAAPSSATRSGDRLSRDHVVLARAGSADIRGELKPRRRDGGRGCAVVVTLR